MTAKVAIYNAIASHVQVIVEAYVCRLRVANDQIHCIFITFRILCEGMYRGIYFIACVFLL